MQVEARGSEVGVHRTEQLTNAAAHAMWWYTSAVGQCYVGCGQFDHVGWSTRLARSALL
jgi:hypothetical protein